MVGRKEHRDGVRCLDCCIIVTWDLHLQPEEFTGSVAHIDS